MPLRWRLLTPIVFLGLTLHGAAQVIPTEGAPPGPRTGMIVGQVVDAAGAPVADAIVRLAMPAYVETLSTTPKGRVMVDGEGRFFFSELPPGEYYLQATKEGYLPAAYGQRVGSTQSSRLALGPGERRTDVKIQIDKFAVIAGTVIDEAGEPVVGVAVRVLAKVFVGGRASFGIGSFLLPSVTTDDRGAFRLSQLPPGSYVVVVPTTHASVPVGLMSQLNAGVLRNELFSAGVSEIAPLGQPRTQQIGEVALLTLNSVTIPPPPAANGSMQIYRTTFYPSASTAGAAAAIALAAGEERTGVTVALRPVRAMRVSGRLVAPDGSAPPPMTLRLSGEAMAGVTRDSLGEVGLDPVTGVSDASGRFTMLGVPAGDYVLTHANPIFARNVQQGVPSFWVSQRLAVGERDLTDLTVAARPAVRVDGRLEFRSAAGPQAPPTLFLRSVGFETPFGEPGGFAGQFTSGEPAFFAIGAGGPYIIRPFETADWVVQSVRIGDADVTDRVFDLQANTTMVVTYTDRPTRLTGAVKNSRGEASATAVVLAFPVDRARWTGQGTSPRHMKRVLTSDTGVYTIGHLPAGDYYVIALEPHDALDWQDPQKLAALAARATRLNVAAGDASKTLDLTVASR